MKKIISLHTMTEYSFLQSTIKIDDLIAFALTNNLSSLVITDRNNMHGVAEFIHKCKQNQIKPIVGIDLDVENFRLILLAKNFEGYQHLCHLASEKGFGKSIKLDEINNSHIIIIDHPTAGMHQKGIDLPKWDNFFIGTTKEHPRGVYLQETKILNTEDNQTLNVVNALREATKINNHRVLPYSLNIKSSALTDRVFEIEQMCNLVLPKALTILPSFPTGTNLSSFQYLQKLVSKKSQEILQEKINLKKYQDRLNYELTVINKLGYADYFLIIQDFVNYAKKVDILIGPGRGSAAGSLVSYVLGITEIDPIAYDLLFERFLNPERVSMPDIDIDIQDTRREEIIKYLFEKYGSNHSAFISTFQKLGAKSSIRDVARLFELANTQALELTKLIPANTTLKEAYQKSSLFRSAITKSKINAQVYALAKKIEGLPRQIGTHAAGIVIASRPIVNIVPTLLSSENFNQIQYAMDYLTDYHLLKIDVLGLRNLTILQNIQHQIALNHQNRRVKLQDIPLNDNQTNNLLSAGDTNGIFQFESYGMKKTLTKVKVNSINDLAAIVSLYRPGPMEFIDTYVKRKFAQEAVPQVSPDYDKVLAPTYGIIVYQEQIMQIAQLFAGMTFAQADLLRRAIGKKNSQLLNSYQKTFINGALGKGHPLALAETVYAKIEAFANYGFNKSHAVAYATLSYRLAFLKARFPFEFYTALIKNSIGSLMTLKTYVYEAKAQRIKVVSPSISESDLNVITKDKKIILPLVIIKGLGSVANQKIIELRNQKAFIDFFETIARLKNEGIGEATITLLIKGNALREFGNMSSLMQALPQALRYGEMITIKKEGKKILNFELLTKPHLTKEPLDLKMEVAAEKSIYGFNLSAFRTLSYEQEAKIVDLKANKRLKIPIWIERVRKFKDKTEKMMGIFNGLDSSAKIEVLVFEEVLNQISNFKKEMLVQATIEWQEKRNTYILVAPWEVIDE